VTASVPEASNHGVEGESPLIAHEAGEKRGARKRFPHSIRLLRHADFERVYKQGRKQYLPSMIVFYLARPAGNAGQPSSLRIGFTVSRALGGAVERNRIKRRLREAVRLSLPVKASADVVINPKKSLLAMDFEALLNEVRRAFVMIEQKVGS
jgi:ribonuclease P protein component